jgi:hypothetical protein
MVSSGYSLSLSVKNIQGQIACIVFMCSAFLVKVNVDSSRDFNKGDRRSGRRNTLEF